MVFGVAYFAVRALHVGAYTIVSRGDPQLREVVVRMATTMLPAAALLIVAGAFEGTARALCWIAALAVDYGGLVARGTAGWRVAAGHFAERHGLIIIIALGESIVALGVGAGGLELDAGIIVAGLLGVAVAAALWWAYFDVVAVVAERRFRRMEPELRVRIARDSYSYIHLPMIAGIVLVALGVKKTTQDVDEPLKLVPTVALFGGIALYYAGHVGFRLRNLGTLNRGRLGALIVSLALIPLAVELDALVEVALAAVLTSSVIAYEAIHFREARSRIRHEHGSM
jgi:low temperature requirement protein LtrA